MKSIPMAKLATPKKAGRGPIDRIHIEPTDNGATVSTHFEPTGKGESRNYPEPQRLGFSDHAAMMQHLHQVTAKLPWLGRAPQRKPMGKAANAKAEEVESSEY